jgi:hypothetical protein
MEVLHEAGEHRRTHYAALCRAVIEMGEERGVVELPEGWAVEWVLASPTSLRPLPPYLKATCLRSETTRRSAGEDVDSVHYVPDLDALTVDIYHDDLADEGMERGKQLPAVIDYVRAFAARAAASEAKALGKKARPEQGGGA